MAVALALFFRDCKSRKKVYYTLFLIIGLASSTFGFECFKYSIGYRNYRKEYIPNVLQRDKLSDDRILYPDVCNKIEKAGITKKDIVISDDIRLRYWCEQKLYSTFEEGVIYFMSGKDQLVYWSRQYKEQDNAIYGKNPEDLIAFAKSVGAKYAILEFNPELSEKFKAKNMITGENSLISIVKFK